RGTLGPLFFSAPRGATISLRIDTGRIMHADDQHLIATQFELDVPAWILQESARAPTCLDDAAKVEFAIRLASRNIEQASGGTLGAAVFLASGELIAAGVNRVIARNCSIAHAEVMAYALAQKRLQRFRLNQDGERFVLATSAQPCCQCYGATIWAGID